MARLSAAAVEAAKSFGRYGDGDGLHLLVGPTSARSWACRVQKDGEWRGLGLGSAKKVTPAQARERVAKVRAQVEFRLDPATERRNEASRVSWRRGDLRSSYLS